MELLLKRKFKAENYTIGDLYVDGRFFCHTIEDKVRPLPARCPDTPMGRACKCKEKEYARTAIPAGTYRITIQRIRRFARFRNTPFYRVFPHDDTSGGIFFRISGVN